MSNPPRHFLLWSVLGLTLLLSHPRSISAQTTSADLVEMQRGIDQLRTAAESWKRQGGPERQVVDQVCLVPDFPTFLEVISTWDDGHFFPILIDDIELNFKFIRAFRPARVVRYPKRVETIEPDQIWTRAVESVGKAWSRDQPPGGAGKELAGDAIPNSLGPTPPGLVFSEPDSPMLAGAVALAAGRFQPLVRWDVEKRFGDVLTFPDAQKLVASLEERVSDLVLSHSRLGDSCDFLTLAGDYPYRYNPLQTAQGPSALDDFLARTPDGRSRWAFTGRLLGNPAESLYRAMCSLFLSPRSALLFNTYDEKDRSWATYSMRTAARQLIKIAPVTHRSGDMVSLKGWHQVLGSVNPFGLMLINTHGSPFQFGLGGDTGVPGDIPPSVPTAIHIIHSFSATDPNDPNTVAGRWLANGAFIYYGSMQEPYLSAFRPPDLISRLIENEVPLGAAFRRMPLEPFGQPWKLVYLGDPLYRLRHGGTGNRVPPDEWTTGSSWPRYSSSARPRANEPDDARFGWIVKTAVAQLQRTNSAQTMPHEEIDEALLAIERTRLSPPLQPFFDALLSDALLEANRPGVLKSRLEAIPVRERGPATKRILETCRFLLLEQYRTHGDFRRTVRLWSELAHSDLPREVLEQLISRLRPLTGTPGHQMEWLNFLHTELRALKGTTAQGVIQAEVDRLRGPR